MTQSAPFSFPELRAFGSDGSSGSSGNQNEASSYIIKFLVQKMARDLLRAMSLAPRQKCPRNVVEMKEAMAAFCGSDNVAISCHCKRSKIILVEVLTEMCSLENIASWNWRKIAVAWSDSVLLTLRSLVCMWKTGRKGG